MNSEQCPTTLLHHPALPESTTGPKPGPKPPKATSYALNLETLENPIRNRLWCTLHRICSPALPFIIVIVASLSLHHSIQTRSSTASHALLADRAVVLCDAFSPFCYSTPPQRRQPGPRRPRRSFCQRASAECPKGFPTPAQFCSPVHDPARRAHSLPFPPPQPPVLFVARRRDI